MIADIRSSKKFKISIFLGSGNYWLSSLLSNKDVRDEIEKTTGAAVETLTAKDLDEMIKIDGTQISAAQRVLAIRKWINLAAAEGIVILAEHIVNYTHIGKGAEGDDRLVEELALLLWELRQEEFEGKIFPNQKNPVSNQQKWGYLDFFKRFTNINVGKITPVFLKYKNKEVCSTIENLLGPNHDKWPGAVSKHVLSCNGTDLSVCKEKNDLKTFAADTLKTMDERGIPMCLVQERAPDRTEWKVVIIKGEIQTIFKYKDATRTVGKKITSGNEKTEVSNLAARVWKWYHSWMKGTGFLDVAIRVDIMRDTRDKYYLNEIECECAALLECVGWRDVVDWVIRMFNSTKKGYCCKHTDKFCYDGPSSSTGTDCKKPFKSNTIETINKTFSSGKEIA